MPAAPSRGWHSAHREFCRLIPYSVTPRAPAELIFAAPSTRLRIWGQEFESLRARQYLAHLRFSVMWYGDGGGTVLFFCHPFCLARTSRTRNSSFPRSNLGTHKVTTLAPRTQILVFTTWS